MMHQISILLEAIRNNSFYVLGAGASAPDVPLGKILTQQLIQCYEQLGSYPINPDAKRTLVNKHLGELSDPILKLMEDDFFEIISEHIISKPHCDLNQTPIQYKLFDFARRPSVLFTANHDKLAHSTNGHYVIPFHGEVDSALGKLDTQRLLRHYNIYGWSKASPNSMFFMRKEYHGLTETEPYVKAEKLYQFTKYLVIVGYSFGSDGTNMDDEETFLFLFKYLFKKYPQKPIVVISPNASNLIEQIESTAKFKCVHINAYWHLLSQAIINHIVKSCSQSSVIAQIEYDYARLLDLKDY